MAESVKALRGRFGTGLRWGLGLGLAGGGLDLLGNGLAVSSLPGEGLWPTVAGFLAGFGGLVSSFLMLAVLPVAGFGLVGLIWSRSRANALACLGAVLLGAPLTLLGINWSERLRHQAFVELSQRSAPVVTAIQEFVRQRGQPPTALEDLVPDFLPELPETGLCAYPNYTLLSGEKAQRFEANPWVLMVSVGSLDFDVFLYLPLQNYPAHGFGGVVERMGDWGYVHE